MWWCRHGLARGTQCSRRGMEWTFPAAGTHWMQTSAKWKRMEVDCTPWSFGGFPLKRLLASTLVSTLLTGVASASSIRVPEDFTRIVDALASAAVGDTVRVGPGVYSTGTSGDVFPLTLGVNNLVLLGAGAGETTLDAQGSLSSVLVLQAEGLHVSGFTITGGWTDEGGGIRIESGSPQIDHNVLIENHAKFYGSAIYVKPGTAPWIHHNVMWRNLDTDIAGYGDPHGVQYLSANGIFEHNLVGRGDSNGLITSGTAKPIVRNNIFYRSEERRVGKECR